VELERNNYKKKTRSTLPSSRRGPRAPAKRRHRPPSPTNAFSTPEALMARAALVGEVEMAFGGEGGEMNPDPAGGP
jgi:hypothetical protein